jgi:hypothetical protein
MNYALDTPVRRSVYVPPAPVYTPVPQHSSNQTQDHHIFSWLQHKPQNHAIFPKPAVSGRHK